jgi:hypothetical protein
MWNRAMSSGGLFEKSVERELREAGDPAEPGLEQLLDEVSTRVGSPAVYIQHRPTKS